MIQLLKSKFFISIAIIAALILAFNFTPLKNTGGYVVKPFSFVGSFFYESGTWSKNFISSFLKAPSLSKKIKEQQKEIDSLKAKNFELLNLEKENNDLRSLLSFSQTNNFNLVSGKIINYRNIFNESVLSVNIGLESGVENDLPAVTENGFFVGKVIEATKNTASILPAIDGKSSIAVSVLNKEEIQGVLKGKLGASMVLDLIPQEANLEIGDIVVTSLLENNTPQNLPIGAVSDIAYKDGELFQTAEITPLALISDLDILSIITSK